MGPSQDLWQEVLIYFGMIGRVLAAPRSCSCPSHTHLESPDVGRFTKSGGRTYLTGPTTLPPCKLSVGTRWGTARVFKHTVTCNKTRPKSVAIENRKADERGAGGGSPELPRRELGVSLSRKDKIGRSSPSVTKIPVGHACRVHGLNHVAVGKKETAARTLPYWDGYPSRSTQPTLCCSLD